MSRSVDQGSHQLDDDPPHVDRDPMRLDESGSDNGAVHDLERHRPPRWTQEPKERPLVLPLAGLRRIFPSKTLANQLQDRRALTIRRDQHRGPER